MKTMTLAMMLVLSAVLGLTFGLTSISQPAFATEPAPSKSTRTGSADSPTAAQKRSADQDLTEVGRRGQLEDMMSLCDVAPPCPSGCSVDATSHKCVEWPGP